MKTRVRASASYAEVEEALKAFLARHPEIAKDASISRGAGIDSILTGAIASMAYEGEGSLFDTMNYGTGDDAKDKAVVADLSKTLKDMGLYYEQGHDWSLGVYPIEESDDERAGREAIDNLAAALKVDPDDLEVGATTETSEGPVITISEGNRSYLVGSSDALDAMAKAQIEENIESDRRSIEKGEEPSYYSLQTYEGHADRQAVREYAETAVQEMENESVSELSTSDKMEWLDENRPDWRDKAFKKAGIDPAQAAQNGEDPTDEMVEAAFGYGEEWVDEQVAARIPDANAAFDFLEEMGQTVLSTGLVNWDAVAEDVLSSDGAAGALGGELYEDSTITYIEL